MSAEVPLHQSPSLLLLHFLLSNVIQKNSARSAAVLIGKFQTFPHFLQLTQQISRNIFPCRAGAEAFRTAPTSYQGWTYTPQKAGSLAERLFRDGFRLFRLRPPGKCAQTQRIRRCFLSNRRIHLRHRRTASLFVISERRFPRVKTKASERTRNMHF